MSILAAAESNLADILNSGGMDADISSVYSVYDEAGSGMYGAIAVVGAFIGAFAVLLLLWYILNVIACWKIFKKAGEPGWKSIIPFYNLYIQYKISWRPVWFLVFMAIWIIAAVSAGNEFISGLCTLAGVVMTIAGNYQLSKAFGHGVGFTVGLTLLNSIFTLILAFGKSQYVGNPCER